MANKAILVQGGDGTAIPAGMVGEILGTKQTGGTNGQIFYVHSATAWGTAGTTTASISSLSKGAYLGTFYMVGAKNNNTTIERFFFEVLINGAASGDLFSTGSTNIANEYTSIAITLPIIIEADNSTVAMKNYSYAENTRVGFSRMALIRIA